MGHSTSHSEVVSCVLLVLAVAGLATSIAGVDKGWGYGTVQDVKPKWGPWGPGKLGVVVAVQLGWLHSTGVVTSKFAPEEIEVDKVKTNEIVGPVVVTVFGMMVLASLFYTYQIAARRYKLPLKVEMETRLLHNLTAAAGVVVLVLSIALYVGLAKVAHDAVEAQFNTYEVEVNLWAWPSWASIAAMLSGVLLLASSAAINDLPPSHPGYEYMPV